MAGDAEFGEQSLHGRDLVGLLGDVDVGEHEGGVGGQRAEHLCSGAVVEIVEAAAQRLAVQRDAGLLSAGTRGLECRGMAAEDGFDRLWIEPPEDVADCGMGGRAAPVQPKNALRLRRWTSMNVTMPRYELQPVTMARMENSRTCGRV
jgi:hypothetical protein